MSDYKLLEETKRNMRRLGISTDLMFTDDDVEEVFNNLSDNPYVNVEGYKNIIMERAMDILKKVNDQIRVDILYMVEDEICNVIDSIED